MCNENHNIILPHNKFFFEQIFQQYHSELLLFAQNILFDKDEAEDVVQDAFVDIWKQKKDIIVKTSIRTLLYTYVKKRALNRIQHLNIIDKHELQVKEAYLAVQSLKIKEKSISKEMQNILNNFPKQMRLIIEYRYFYDWSYKDIAEVLDIKVNTVKTHISRALKRLRTETKDAKSYGLPIITLFLINSALQQLSYLYSLPLQ